MTQNDRNANRVMILLFFGVLMGALDISIVGPAIPSITETIKVPEKELSWIFSIYVLFNLVGISLFAKLSDMLGRRYIYILVLGIFGLGSLVVALADNFSVLLAGRAIQGFGASGIFPVASAVIGDRFPPEKRGRMLGLLGAVWGIAFIIGPILAGTLLAFFEWHVLFIINIPISALLMFFSLKYLDNTRVDSGTATDWPGIILLGLFLASITFGINRFDPEEGMASFLSAEVWPFFAGSLVTLLVLFLNERKAREPVINPTLFKSRQIRIVGFIAIITGLFQSAFVFIPNLAVQTFQVSSSTASFMLLPFVLATAIGSPVFGRMLDKTGSRLVVLIGIYLSAFGLFLLALAGGYQVGFYGSGILIGLGLSVLAGSGLRYIMLNEVGASERAVTQGVLTIFISMGQIAGSAAIGTIAAIGADPAQGYKNAFYLLSLLMALTFFLAFRLKKKSEEQVQIS